MVCASHPLYHYETWIRKSDLSVHGRVDRKIPDENDGERTVFFDIWADEWEICERDKESYVGKRLYVAITRRHDEKYNDSSYN